MIPDSEDSTELIEQLVERALELRDRGEPVCLEELCRGDTTLIEAVAQALGHEAELAAWAASGREVDALRGRVLAGRYRLDRRIGAGAMGSVYRAFDLELKRAVAIKVLQPHLFGEPDAVARFFREAEILASLRHPHVVAIHDRGTTDDGLHFLVMELLQGAPLTAVLDQRERLVENEGRDAARDTDWIAEVLLSTPPPETSYVRQCARWTAELSSGLAAAHAAGIYHRDVKPSNVFIGRDGRALLLDFGIAARSNDAGPTGRESTIGTPRYMAPEQGKASCAPSPQLDVYALAATLYHMVGGKAPYDGSARSVLVTVQRENPTPLGRLRPDLPADLQAIVECGMAREPWQRYGGAALLESDLRAFLEHQPVVARRRGPLARLLYRARRSRAVRALALAVLVATLSVAIPSWLRARERQRQQQALALRAELPPLLTLGQHPVVAEASKRGELRRVIDRALVLAPDDIALRCLRLGFRSDHGDADGAAEDAGELARRWPSPLTAAVRTRLAAAERGGDVDLSALPAAGSDADRLIAGYLAMRRLDYDAAGALLEGVDSEPAAVEFWLLARLVDGVRRNDHELLQQLYDRALRLEGSYGRTTTRTRHVIGTALVTMKRWSEAVAPLRELLRMNPDSYPTLQNLGVAYRRLGALPEAEDALRRALALRPDSPNALSTLAKVRAARHDYDEAHALAARIPAPGRFAWMRHEAEATVEFEHSLALLSSGDSDAAARAAYEAIGHLETTISLGHRSTVVQMNLQACLAIAEGDRSRLCKALCKLLAIDPHNAVHLDNLARKLPDTLGATEVAALRDFLRALASEAAHPRSAGSGSDNAHTDPGERR